MGSESLVDFSKGWVKADQTGSALELIPATPHSTCQSSLSQDIQNILFPTKYQLSAHHVI